MTSCTDLKKIVRARLKSAKTLLSAGDWDGAAYMFGYVLECALKAATCKSLRLKDYPEKKRVDGHFMTHNFDQLLVLSGTSDLFNISGDQLTFQNWSDFTKEFPGDWPAMRYNIERQGNFDKIKTNQLLTNLTDKPYGILEVIKNKKRW